MSRVPISAKTAAHALRGLALGTSCSLILISEERRRRLDLARTLVENGRLIKAQRSYSTAGAAAASLPVESVDDPSTREGHIVSKRDFSWIDLGIDLGPVGETSLGPRLPLPQQDARGPAVPETCRDEPISHAKLLPTKSDPTATIFPTLDLASVLDGEPKQEKELVLGTFSMSEKAELTAFLREMAAIEALPSLPSEFVESIIPLLQRLEQQDKVPAAQMVLDGLCRHPDIHSQQLNGISPEFLLRCFLTSRAYYDSTRRSRRRFKLATYVFWAHHRHLASPKENTRLMELIAELFARNDAAYEAQSFLATSHVQAGRCKTAKLVVVPVAKLYREQGRTAALNRWLELAEAAGVPINAHYSGSNLLKRWEIEDSPEQMGAPRDRCLPKLKEDLRRPLSSESEKLNEEQRVLFDRMDEKANAGDCEGVLDCYSEALGAGVEASVPCVRLAVEAAVGLEDIHSPKALEIIKEAHKASIDIEPVVQTLLLSRFNAIGNYQMDNEDEARRGQAFNTMRALLETVRPYYEQPSEMVYNRAIRVCLQVAELTQARELCLQLAEEHWGGDMLHKAFNFANLATIAVRTKDFHLLRKLLEALPERAYKDQDMCKQALTYARSRLRVMIDSAEAPEDVQRYKTALGSVQVAFQDVKQARSSKHRKLRTRVKYEAFEGLTTRTPGEKRGWKRPGEWLRDEGLEVTVSQVDL